MAPRRAPSAQGLASAPVPAQRTPPRVQPGARSSKPRAPSPPARWANQKKEKKAPYDEGRLIFLAGVVKDKGVGALSPTQLTELMELKEQAELQAVAGPRKKTGGAKAEGGARRRSVSDSSGLTGAAKRWLQEQRGVDSRADQDALAAEIAALAAGSADKLLSKLSAEVQTTKASNAEAKILHRAALHTHNKHARSPSSPSSPNAASRSELNGDDRAEAGGWATAVDPATGDPFAAGTFNYDGGHFSFPTARHLFAAQS